MDQLWLKKTIKLFLKYRILLFTVFRYLSEKYLEQINEVEEEEEYLPKTIGTSKFFFIYVWSEKQDNKLKKVIFEQYYKEEEKTHVATESL